MRYLTILIAVFLSLPVSAQSWFKESVKGNGELSTITRNIDDYDHITIAGPFNIELVKGTEGKLIISIEENLEKYLVTKVKEDKLVIRWDNNFKVRPKKSIHITLPFEDIESLVLAGSGDIETKDEISANEFTIKSAGSGNINLLLSTDEFVCTMAGSGNVTLKGDARDFDCSKAGSGNLYGYEFECDNIEITGAGSGNAEVFVTKNLEAKMAGSGNIVYKGSPEENNIKVVGSGSIKMK